MLSFLLFLSITNAEVQPSEKQTNPDIKLYRELPPTNQNQLRDL